MDRLGEIQCGRRRYSDTDIIYNASLHVTYRFNKWTITYKMKINILMEIQVLGSLVHVTVIYYIHLLYQLHLVV
jgi:hypothetical protein